MCGTNLRGRHRLGQRHPRAARERLRLRDPSPRHEPARRLRQLHDGQRQQEHDGQGADPEERTPPGRVRQDEGDQRSEHSAGRNPAVDNGIEQVPLLRRCELGHQRPDGRDERADPDAGDEPEEAKGLHRCRQRRRGHPDREPGKVDEYDAASPDPVPDRPGRECADEDTDEGVRPEGAGLRGSERPELARVLEQGGHDGAVDDEVIPVEDECEHRQRDHPRGAAAA